MANITRALAVLVAAALIQGPVLATRIAIIRSHGQAALRADLAAQSAHRVTQHTIRSRVSRAPDVNPSPGRHAFQPAAGGTPLTPIGAE